MRTALLSLILSVYAATAFAQDSIPFLWQAEDASEKIFITDPLPEYPGGDVALLKYLAEVPYPAEAYQNGIEGTVYLKCTIAENGNITNISVLKGLDKLLNKAAISHVNKMKPWKPAVSMATGKPVAVDYIIPVKFSSNAENYLILPNNSSNFFSRY